MRLLNDVGTQTDIVGLAITEFLPWDMLRLSEALGELPTCVTTPVETASSTTGFGSESNRKLVGVGNQYAPISNPYNHLSAFFWPTGPTAGTAV